MADRKDLAAQILSELEGELVLARGEQDVANQKVLRLERQVDAARILTSDGEGKSMPTAMTTVIGRPKLFRARKIKHFVLHYMQESGERGWILAKDLHKKIVATGEPVGSATYLYDILAKLEEDGDVEIRKDDKGKNFSVRLKPLVPGKIIEQRPSAQ